MTLDLEDRLWRELEAAAERTAQRGRLARRAAATLAVLPRAGVRPALATLAGLALVIATVIALNRPQPPNAPHWRIDRFRLAGTDLSGGVVAYGSLWTYDRVTGAVLRVDPAARRVVARVPLHAAWPDVAVGAGVDALWAVSTHRTGHTAAPANPPPVRLKRIDPATNRITASITLRARDGTTLVPQGLTVNSSAVWVWGDAGALRVDTDTLRVNGSITVSGDSFRGFAVTDTQAWAVTEIGRLLRFDARTTARLSALPGTPLDRPQPIVVLPHGVFIDRQDGSSASLDLTSGRPRWIAHAGEGIRDAHLVGGRLWLLAADPAQSHDDLLALDPNTGAPNARIALPVTATSAVAPDGRALLVTTQGGDVFTVQP